MTGTTNSAGHYGVEIKSGGFGVNTMARDSENISQESLEQFFADYDNNARIITTQSVRQVSCCWSDWS
jgi:hypothetical protein